jgi:hypothetical protein
MKPTPTSESHGKRLLSIKDMVEQYGGSIWAWRTAAWSGELPHIRLRNKIFFDRPDAEDFIQSLKARS